MSGKNTTILVVDDEEFSIEYITEIVTDDGYKVMTASNGQEALEIFEKNHQHIDLVLLDWMMPEMSGIEFLDHMELFEQKNNLEHTPVIMQTARAGVTDTIEGKRTSVFYYLTKPYTADLLLSVIHSAVAK